jgi:hypothetical protein
METSPTLAGYLSFIRNVMGITTAQLPDNAPSIGWTYEVAKAWVNRSLIKWCAPRSPYASMYAIAVYNFAGDRLITYGQDPADAPYVEGTDPPQKFFAYSRSTWKIFGFVSGVVQSTSDDGTSVSMVVPEAFKNFTLADLQSLKTPWGREYMAIAQSYGPSIWGLS